jgi:PAS domain S-box-containing protein
VPTSASTTVLKPTEPPFQKLSPEELVTRLAAIVDSSEDAIIGREDDGTINTWNKAATRMFGYEPKEVVGQSILLIVPPDLHGEELENLERLRRGEHIKHYQTQRLRKGGHRVDITIAVSPISDSGNRVIGSALIARDIGVQQREQAAHARLAAIVESSDDAIIAKDLNGIVTDWNATAERMFGYTAEEMVGRSILTIVPPELQHEEPIILSKIRAGERLEHYETSRLHKSGRRVDVSLTLSPMRDARGRVFGASKIARDITDRIRSDNARMMLAAIVESSEDAIISKTLDGIITTWNASAERLFGYKPEEIIGQSVLRLIPRELHYEEPHIIAKLRSGERIEHFETRRMRKNGEIIDISLTVSPIRDQKGRVVGASKIVRDISDRKAAEAAIIEKEKLAAAGRLAATLAHEVNNPLESITNLAYLLAHHQPLDEESRRYADLLLKEVQRAGEITRQTLSYHKATRERSQVDISEILEHISRWKRKKLDAKGIRLKLEFVDPPQVSGYPGELRQVFDNLIENAMDATPSGGTIRVRARGQRLGSSQGLRVSVCDSGEGIPRSALFKIFDPFFTTKPKTGSGLGLWVTREIVQKHGGTIRARSSRTGQRHGSVFTITLPTQPTEAREPQRKSVSFLVR